MPIWMACFFQDHNSDFMDESINFHDHVMALSILILVVVGGMASMNMSTSTSKSFTIIPLKMEFIEMMILIYPTLLIMYIIHPTIITNLPFYHFENENPLAVKITGHQWFWNYEYLNTLNNKKFDSFMESEDYPRLLMTSNHLILPSKLPISFFLTSNDVIHCWALPTMAIKGDAFPGRLNQVFTVFNRVGVYSGQCSEICGINHSFMPITVSVIPVEEFQKSVSSSM